MNYTSHLTPSSQPSPLKEKTLIFPVNHFVQVCFKNYTCSGKLSAALNLVKKMVKYHWTPTLLYFKNFTSWVKKGKKCINISTLFFSSVINANNPIVTSDNTSCVKCTSPPPTSPALSKPSTPITDIF